MVQLSAEICSNFDAARSREWLETNGLGGFASSTIIGLNTRRYHGLLTAATKPPVGRLVLLSKLEETLVLNGSRYNLSTNHYPGATYPSGFQYLREFRLDPFPIFVFDVDGIQIEKRVFMVHGENTTVVEYTVTGVCQDCSIELRPLIAFRDYHSTTHANVGLNAAVDNQPGLARIQPYADLPALYFAHNANHVEQTGSWYYNFEYEVERERGLDFHEDLFNPFLLSFNFSGSGEATVIASTDPRNAEQAHMLRGAEIARREQVLTGAPNGEPLVRALTAAADQFIAQRGDLKTVIAGYHWFGDWGRDTMIALPGLTLTTGKAAIAKEILLAFAKHVDQGMLPNLFPDAGESPEYNTVDAALWFFEAVRALAKRTGDLKFVREHLYDVMRDMIDWHVRGTRYGIRVDVDGLLAAGEPGAQLTWMDAKIGDWVVTPRHGKPVEIQALWYNALCTMQEFAEDFHDSVGRGRYASMAAETKGNFNAAFWNEDTGGLYDVVNREDRDASIRPNQIFAVSLTHSMLEASRARRVVEIVQHELLTPYGLRTLAAGDPQYRPRYEGDPLGRDSAYHQGTVWPWLMGPFLSAYVRVHQSSKQAREQAAKWLSGCEQHLTEAGLGQISEIFDADPPHNPRGCMAQAWSVAELLRVAAEDIFIDDGSESSAHETAASTGFYGSMTKSKAPTSTPAVQAVATTSHSQTPMC